MAARLTKGIDLLSEVAGAGLVAEKGCVVTYNARFFLRRGEEVTRDALSIAAYRSSLNIRTIGDVELIDHTTILGKRQPIAGVEKSLYGMQPGGYREVLASAHLCYGKSGVEGRIPPNAALRIALWVNDVQIVSY